MLHTGIQWYEHVSFCEGTSSQSASTCPVVTYHNRYRRRRAILAIHVDKLLFAQDLIGLVETCPLRRPGIAYLMSLTANKNDNVLACC